MFRKLPLILVSQIGFDQVLSHANLITYISYCLFTSSNKLRAQVADVLAALCVLSLHDGHRVVLAALSDFRVAHDEKFRFEYLVDSIRLKDLGAESDEDEEEDEAGLWEYRTAAMSLVNAIANSPEDLEERMMLRDEFSRRGLNEAMAVSGLLVRFASLITETKVQGLRYVNPPEYLLTQISVYTEERQEDQEELHERTIGRSRAEYVSGFARLELELIRLLPQYHRRPSDRAH